MTPHALAHWMIAAELLASPALAQTGTPKPPDYPARPVRFIVPYLAGGTSDVLARGLAERLGKSLGQPFVLDFRPGAGGNLGTDLAAKSRPDGYTVVLATVGPFATNVTLQPEKLAFDPARDFQPISLLATSPLILITHPSIPARSVAELVRLAKSRPNQLNYATPGIGTANHLVMETFDKLAGIRITHIAFKGTAQSLIALMSGDIELLVGQIPSTRAQIKAGRVRPLAISGTRRSRVLPEVPTFGEGGVRGVEAVSWFGIAVPAGTPGEIVGLLSAEVMRAVASPELNTLYVSAGVEPQTNTPQQYAAFIRAEVTRWGQAVKNAGLR